MRTSKPKTSYNDFSEDEEPSYQTSKFRSMPQQMPQTSQAGPVIYLTNMSFDVNEQDIMSFLEDYKPVRAKLLHDTQGRSKGTGFVELKSSDYAKLAITNLSN